MDRTAREHSVDMPVVTVVVVMMGDAVVLADVSAGGLGCCPASTGAALSDVGDMPGAGGPCRMGITGPSTSQPGMSLGSFALSLAKASTQLVPYGRG